MSLLNRKFLFSLVIILLLVSPLFRSGLFQTHDAEANIARFAAYYKSFADGQFPPRWAGDLNYRYGSPVLIFYYPLTGYLSSLIHLLGISFENVYKILISLGFISSFFTFYLWSKNKFSKSTAFFSSMLYLFVPYHLLNLYVRGDVAELIALAVVPLVFLYLDKISLNKKVTDVLIGGVIYGLLITAHNGIALMFSPVLVLYCFLSKDRKSFMLSSFMLFEGLCLSSFFWIPVIFEGKYTNAKLFVGQMYKSNFLNLGQVLYSPWGFGSDIKKAGSLSPQVGIPFIIFSFVSIFFFVKDILNKRIMFWIFIFAFAVFMTLPFSDILWSRLELLQLLEFPWRFISLASFSSIVLSAFVLEKIKSKKIVFLIFIGTLIYCLIFIKTDKQLESNPDSFYNNYPYTTYFHGEANPIWTAGDAFAFPDNPYEIFGNGKVLNFTKKTNEHKFDTISSSPFEYVDNTIYFPGWKAIVDEKKIPIEFQSIQHRGLITLTIPSGKHSVKIQFAESAVRLYADVISLASVILVGLGIIFRKRVKVFNE